MTKAALFIPQDVSAHQQTAWKNLIATVRSLSAASAQTAAAAPAASTNTQALQAEISALQAALLALQNQINGLTTTYTCAQAITKGQVVYESSNGFISIADYTTLPTTQPTLGIASKAGNIGDKIEVIGEGGTATGFTGLTAGPLYLGANGTLLSAIPAPPNYAIRVGYAVDSSSVLVNIGPPMLLGGGNPAEALSIDPVTGLLETFTGNSGIVTNAAGTDQYWLVATLPASSPATYDHIDLRITGSEQWFAANIRAIEFTAGNRSGFAAAWSTTVGTYTILPLSWGIRAYQRGTGETDIYVYVQAGVFESLSYQILDSIQVLVVNSQTPITSPAGTLVFDTTNPTTYPPVTALGLPQAANSVYAGPQVGAAALPTFRPLVDVDLPLGARTYLARVAATANVASLSGTPTIDGVATNIGDVIFLPFQTSAGDNGPWVAQVTTWTRPTTFDVGRHVGSAQVYVQEGATLDSTYWTCTALAPNDVVGTNNLPFQQQGGSGSGTVTTFSAANASPLFNTIVTNPTTTPALSFAIISQVANVVYAGPSSGGATAPTFRALTLADMPAGIGGVSSVSSGNASPLFNVTVSTPTTTPAFSYSLVSQSANLVYAGPSSGGASTPTFRALTLADEASSTVSAGTGGTTSGTGATSLYSYTLPANTINSARKTLRITGCLIASASPAGTGTVSFTLGGTGISSNIGIATPVTAVWFSITLVWTSSSTAAAYNYFGIDPAPVSAVTTISAGTGLSINWTSSNALAITGTASAGTIQLIALSVEAP